MWKRQVLFLLGWALLGNFSLPAAEIGSVVRDYEYPDIFTYKTHLIGKSNVNQFTFEEESDLLPEYFRVFVKASKAELGQTVEVVFHYKQHQSGDFKERREQLTLSKRTQKVTFLFTKQEIAVEGQVEQWAVRLLKEGAILAEQKSSGNTNADLREKTSSTKSKTSKKSH